MPLLNDKKFQMRASADFFAQIDKGRRTQPDIPGRSEAIRRLVEIALTGKKPKALFAPSRKPNSDF